MDVLRVAPALNSKICLRHMPEETYQVLANKYRPHSFEDLIGQDVLVQTLSHAIEQERVAGAFLLTGIRGVGKTTTARIIARSLNCEKGPTVTPCGVCEHCVSITQGRHQDVLEVDAASRTGVDDMREIIDNCRYMPSSAQYKIYIIDEVHMLSKSAFNALLKTLEEPPKHVKFIFATTEIRKIPVTVISRCQRFDLKRIDDQTLAAHLSNIAEKEGATIDQDAALLITRAGEGSVRDGLSLLDQAITNGQKKVTATIVKEMIGLADHSDMITLFEQIVTGQNKEALAHIQQLYQKGADMGLVFESLLSLTHLGTTFHVTSSLDAPELSDIENKRLQEIASKLSITYLTRLWQLTLKAIQELRYAPQQLLASEMLVIRLCHMAQLPPLEELLETKSNSAPKAATPATPVAPQVTSAPQALALETPSPAPAATPQVATAQISLGSFNALVALFEQKGEILLHSWLESEMRLVSFEPGRLEMNVPNTVPQDVPGKIGSLLTEWTGTRWVCVASDEAGSASLKEQADSAKAQALEDVSQEEDVKEILDAFPGAKVTAIN